jgi:hypothetical protein
MDLPGAPAGWDSPEARPSVLLVTVEPGPGRRTHARRPSVLVAGLGTLPAIAAAAVIAVLPAASRDSAASRARVPAPVIPTPRAPIHRPAAVLVDSRYPDTPLAGG